MSETDVIMSVLTVCNKARESMVKEGKPDTRTYRQIERIEALCLSNMAESETPVTGQGIAAVIPNTSGLEGVGRV